MTIISLMKDYSISICGFGYVGSALGFLLEKNNIKYNVYDIIKKQGKFNYFSSLEELISNSEKEDKINYYIIAVPTLCNENGSCNISIVESIIKNIKFLIKKQSVIIIKSTIVPGTTKKLNNFYKSDLLDIVCCPEFITEKNYKMDMYNAEFVLLGVMSNKDLLFIQQLIKLFRQIYNHKSIDIYIKSQEEAELFKYTVNSYLALKVGYFNEINEICEKMDINYESFKKLFQLEPRIGNYGTIVPGDNGYGYSGSSLPKDLKAMSKLQEVLFIDNSLLQGLIHRNETYFILKKKEKIE